MCWDLIMLVFEGVKIFWRLNCCTYVSQGLQQIKSRGGSQNLSVYLATSNDTVRGPGST